MITHSFPKIYFRFELNFNHIRHSRIFHMARCAIFHCGFAAISQFAKQIISLFFLGRCLGGCRRHRRNESDFLDCEGFLLRCRCQLGLGKLIK